MRYPFCDSYLPMQTEYTKGPTTTLSSSVPSCRSLSSSEDGPSGHSSLSDGKLTWNVQDSIKHRILYLSEQLRVEKASRDENTVGYLKLVSKADRHQALHIRQAFEKVNQRTSATIAQIERRLRQCHQQLQELEEGCRPKDLVLGTKSSLDNNCKQPREKVLCAEPPRPGGEDCSSSDLSTVIRHVPLQAHFPACQQQRSLESKCGAQPRALLEQKMKEELREVKMVHLSLQESYQSLREQYLTDLQASLESLQKEKSRQVLLEGQVNGHLQGHLDEIYHLKQNLACTEERIVYLSYERAKEIWEVMDTFKNRMGKLEALQQVTQLGLTERPQSWPQDILCHLTSLLLKLATVLLVLLSGTCACPLLLHLRLHTCTMLLLLGLSTLAWQKRHAISAPEWQAWVPSRWRWFARASRPPPKGP
ncbi:testis-specific protein TEX28 [Bubalus bubalis]|uniref:testis-specific protein TEX28 n=1 Tax=Bubalus bubalis TaxID=89462 RepID=UPI000DBC8582|nr:testis-specific protein TEX28 [Bubalus bubalis]